MKYVLFSSGLIVLVIAWSGPLRALIPHAFYAHMMMHIAVVALATPLLAAGLAQTRFDPVCFIPGWFAPVPASIVELITVWGWHAPALHHIARQTGWGLILEQGMFLATALFVWLSAFGGMPNRRLAQASGGIIGLLLTSMHMTLLGALLTLSPRVLYRHPGNTLEIDALQDQQIGGLIMLVGGGSAYLIGGLILMATILKSRAHTDGQQVP